MRDAYPRSETQQSHSKNAVEISLQSDYWKQRRIGNGVFSFFSLRWNLSWTFLLPLSLRLHLHTYSMAKVSITISLSLSLCDARKWRLTACWQHWYVLRFSFLCSASAAVGGTAKPWRSRAEEREIGLKGNKTKPASRNAGRILGRDG